MRPIIALAAAALLAVTFFSTEASARMGGGGFRGGFHRGFGFRHFGPRFAFGAPFAYGAYAAWPYSYCLRGRLPGAAPIWTAYGWRIRWVNVCY